MTVQAPASVRSLAAAYTCGHCNSEPAQLTQDTSGVWRLAIGHDAGCPVLTGAVPDTPDVLRAMQEHQ
ncbi:hypothetical protein NRF20_20800 [Streptomyces sp. R-74717]|uniref:hypothetical protein n=1 Tax=Streptomyces sp. R-74717 TaxID=2969820 RepID=UPI0039B564FF